MRAPVSTRLLAGLALISLTLALTSLALSTESRAPAVAAPSSADQGLETEIVDLTGVVGPGDEIVVTVAVHNAGENKIEDGALELRFRSTQLISRSAVEMWEEPDAEEVDPLRAAGAVVRQVNLPDLDPGEERLEELRISTDQLYLPHSANQWGPRGIAVDSKIGAETVQRERTFVIWFPTSAEQLYPTQISVLAPLVGSPPGQEGGIAQGERLEKLLHATSEFAVSYALDPHLLTGTDTEITASQLRDALAGHEVFALPEFDADIAALAHVEQLDAAEYLREARTKITAALDTTASDILLWPEGNSDLEMADLAVRNQQSGVGALLTGPAQLAPSLPLTYTPTGKARIETNSGQIPALIPDDAMSTTLTASTTAGVQAAPIRARQRLLADSAVITQERPADPRHVLITAPRSWNPDPERAEILLTALSEAPWVELEEVRTLLGSPVPDFEREPLPLYQAGNKEIPSELVVSTRAAEEALHDFRSLVPQPEHVHPRVDSQLKAIVSTGWLHSPTERSDLVEEIAAEIRELSNAVSVIPGGAVNLITDSGEIPVLINNAFSQDVEISVRLESNSSFLITTKPITADLPAQSETTILIPVEAIGNRDVDVVVHLETESGQQIGAPQTISVRVRAGWEDAGTRAVGTVLAALFLIGIFRTVRRGRKRTAQ